jgi:hypothetical protein
MLDSPNAWLYLLLWCKNESLLRFCHKGKVNSGNHHGSCIIIAETTSIAIGKR